MVTAGNWPWWLMERASLRFSKWVNALSGTGVGAAGVLALLDPPPPPPPPDDDEDEVDAREVPLSEVVALDEVVPLVLALLSTVEVEFAVDEEDNADVESTLAVAGFELVVLFVTAVVPAPAVETPEVAVGVSSEFPGDGALPDPAPEDDPAVFEEVDPDVALVDDD